MYQPRDLAVLIPMLGRAHRVKPLIESLTATASGARVVWMVTDFDLDVAQALNRVPMSVRGIGYSSAPNEVGDYARKINKAISYTDEPLLFFGADDLLFHPGWFEAACRRLYDDPAVGVVGTNDLGNPRVMRGEHATHCLVTRDYIMRHGTIDEDGKALHEGYVHEYVDDELVGTAKHRGAWAFAEDSHVEHLHPDWHPEVPRDASYDAQQHRMALSHGLYVERRNLWT